nr:MAG TPA: Hia (Adhesin), outer membrane, Hia adhesin.0A [Caudoviricetes sp.]
MNKKIIVTTSAIAAMAVNVMANNIVTGPVEPNTTAPVATGYNSIASGANAVVNATNSVALGRDNKITGDDTIVIGGGNGTVAGGQSTAIGYNNYIGAHQEQTVIGANSVVDNQGAITIGTHSVTRGIDAVTIGNNASAPVQNSVAIGTNSQTYNAVPFGQMQINGTTHIFAGEQPNSTVSFGSKKSDTYSNLDNYNRQLQNVAAGRVEADSLDAVNGSQLFAAIDEINSNGLAITKNTQNIAKNKQNIAGNTSAITTNTKAINDLSKISDNHNKALVNHENRIQTLENTDKSLKTDLANTQNQVNINTNDITGLKGKINVDTTAIKNELNNKINATQQRINKLGASSAALSGLHPLDFNRNDKASYAVSYGHYRNANAFALGAFYRPNERTMYGVGVTLGGETQLTLNASFKVGKGSDYLAEAKTENGRIAQLEKLVQALTDEVAALKGK